MGKLRCYCHATIAPQAYRNWCGAIAVSTCGADTNFQRRSVQSAGRRCGAAAKMAAQQRGPATLRFVPIITGIWYDM